MAKLKLVLPVICLAVGAGGGIGAGLMLGGHKEDAAAADSSKAGPEATTKPDATPEPDYSADPSATSEFAEIGNQFVVPVVRDGSVRALVVLSLTLEVVPGGSETVFAKEPRLRDAFLQVMFDHANHGGFDAAFTQAERMSTLRQGLREVARKLLGKTVHDILIVDIIRQEV